MDKSKKIKVVAVSIAAVLIAAAIVVVLGLFVLNQPTTSLLNGRAFKNAYNNETEIYFNAFDDENVFYNGGDVNVIEGLSFVDVSDAKDESIKLYSNGTQMFVLSNLKIELPEDCCLFFVDKDKVTTMKFNNVDTSNVVRMDYMFLGCTNLEVLDISEFNTSKVTTMAAMFCQCLKLSELDLTGFATENVTEIDQIFSGCKSLKVVDLSGFDTSKVATMFYMFADCFELETIYVGDKWSTSNLADRSYDIFRRNNKLVGAVAFDDSKTDASMANWETGYLTYKAA
ncbi:MAG: BspA family leucine-rich repeat surface protein [Clostridiales bacterium]|nr:BspA family leucine-rich repeat surface protein [Clostridiales bacterium]